jgi:anaerobic ribonucleoside-triphosphate reductase activating protein
MAQEIIESGCEGLTLSGGEPFLQAEALAELVREVQTRRDVGVIVYSGFTLEELRERSDALALLRKTDILIDGRYVKQLDDGRAYIGSSNQRLHYLTDRYKAEGEKYYSAQKRRAEIRFTADTVTLIGVPSANVLAVWREIKAKNGGAENDF